MAKKKIPTPKKSKVTTTSKAEARKLKKPEYKTLRLTKRIKSDKPPIPGSLSLFGTSLATIRSRWLMFSGITIVYGVLTLFLVRGLGGFNLGLVKEEVNELFNRDLDRVSSGAILFTYLLSTTGSSSTSTGGVYQAFLLIIMSLAVIWAIRHVSAKSRVSIKDAFYKGMYPLIPFVIVLMVIALQLLPFVGGAWVFVNVIGGGVASSGIEQLAWGLLFALFTVLSIYMTSSSVFALYIVTLPDMTPLAALQSARKLVLHRRWMVIRKILFLPIVLLVLSAAVLIPLIIAAPLLAELTFFLFTMFALIVIHSYTYTLYRALL